MANPILSTFRLLRAGLVFAGFGVKLVPKGLPVPFALRLAEVLTAPLRALNAAFGAEVPADQRIAAALTRLGPSYIKLGQFLATRADLIGSETASDLRHLQDRLPPFSMAEAQAAIEASLGGKVEDHFVELSPPIAAASIAQVHKGVVEDAAGRREVAVKILRPGVERRFRQDLDSYRFAAALIERYHPPIRRLKPLAVVENLRRTTELEMDLRLEAAAISEMADNITGDPGFRVPSVDWRRTQRRVLTIEWIDGIGIGETDKLAAAGHDLSALGLTVLQSFLKHAMRDGFFHGDMHQGNLIVTKDGTIVAVDFGIMGRLGMRERRFLAEILFGLITRDYRRAAQVHFDAGYVPPHHSVEVFAQAMRAIGEPIHGRTADEISMADLLGQLFAYTEVFDMETRPELILLQKSMVIVEGVARSLDPHLNLWTAAEPIARAWIEKNYGLEGRIRDAGEGAELMGRVIAEVPRLMHEAERQASAVTRMVSEGVRLDDASLERLAEVQARDGRVFRVVVAIVAVLALALAAGRWMM